ARIVFACIAEELIGHARSGKDRGLGTELLREPKVAEDALAFGLRQAQQGRRLDVDGVPFGIQRFGESLARAHQPLSTTIGADRDEDALTRSPDRRDRLFLAILTHL